MPAPSRKTALAVLVSRITTLIIQFKKDSRERFLSKCQKKNTHKQRNKRCGKSVPPSKDGQDIRPSFQGLCPQAPKRAGRRPKKLEGRGGGGCFDSRFTGAEIQNSRLRCSVDPDIHLHQRPQDEGWQGEHKKHRKGERDPVQFFLQSPCSEVDQLYHPEQTACRQSSVQHAQHCAKHSRAVKRRGRGPAGEENQGTVPHLINVFRYLSG